VRTDPFKLICAVPHMPCLAWLAGGPVTYFYPTSDNLAQISFVKGRTLEKPTFPE